MEVKQVAQYRAVWRVKIL